MIAVQWVRSLVRFGLRFSFWMNLQGKVGLVGMVLHITIFPGLEHGFFLREGYPKGARS